MTTTTPNYGLYLYSEIADGSGSFIQFRLDVAGDINAAGSGSSNMQIIDGALGNINTILSNGWIPDSDTWIYVSSTSFKITGKNVTSKFPVGTKIKLTQTTVKYFYVTAAAFATDTTVTIAGGSIYTLANATIVNPYYSYAETPQNYPFYAIWETIKVGSSPDKSSDPAVSVARTLNVDINSHGVMDSSIFNGYAGRAYGAFDSFFETGGTANLNHVIGFQSRGEHAGSGSLTTYYGFGNFPNNTGGTITNMYGVYLASPIGGGAITNLYGLYIEDQTVGGTLNYAIYTKGGAVSFGGYVAVRSGTLSVEHTSLPISAKRNVSLTTGNITLASLLAKSSGDMTDGFASIISFNVQDNTSISTGLASIGGVRAGADNTGDFIVTTTAAGSNSEKFRVTSEGDIKVIAGRLYPYAVAAVSAPAYAEGAIYYDLTSHKLMIGGASGWETITSI